MAVLRTVARRQLRQGQTGKTKDWTTDRGTTCCRAPASRPQSPGVMVVILHSDRYRHEIRSCLVP